MTSLIQVQFNNLYLLSGRFLIGIILLNFYSNFIAQFPLKENGY
tara:strand:+ start:9290 stop:9421 length:132 start_codon:yes stop_codon:yes gene_type:complete